MKLHSFQELVTRIAHISTRDGKPIPVKFSGNGAYTDGKHINLPALIAGTVLTPNEYSIMLGYALHEGPGHLTHTDMDDYIAACKSRNDPVFAQVLNILEDVRIENLDIARYPGDKKYLNATHQYVDDKVPPEKCANPGLLGLVYKEGFTKYRDLDTVRLKGQLHQRCPKQRCYVSLPKCENTLDVIALAELVTAEIRATQEVEKQHKAEREEQKRQQQQQKDDGTQSTQGKGQDEPEGEQEQDEQQDQGQGQDQDTSTEQEGESSESDGGDPGTGLDEDPAESSDDQDQDEEDEELDHEPEGQGQEDSQGTDIQADDQGNPEDGNNPSPTPDSGEPEDCMEPGDGDFDDNSNSDDTNSETGDGTGPNSHGHGQGTEQDPEGEPQELQDPEPDYEPEPDLDTSAEEWNEITEIGNLLQEILDQVKTDNKEAPSTYKLPGQTPNDLVLPPADITLDRIFAQGEEDLDAYTNIRAQLTAQITALKKMLRIQLQARSRKSWLRGLEEATHLDRERPHVVATGHHHVFKDKRERQLIDTSIELMIDLSGSMRQDIVQSAAIILAEALSAIPQLKLSITGFKTNHQFCMDRFGTGRSQGMDILVFKDYAEPYVKCRAKLGGISTSGNTPLGDAYGKALERILARQEPRRIIFLITDGEPNFHKTDQRHNDYLLMERVHKKAKRLGIETLGLGIGSPSGIGFLKAYVDRCLRIQSATTLPQDLMQALKGTIR